jgi:hypothetical protein
LHVTRQVILAEGGQDRKQQGQADEASFHCGLRERTETTIEIPERKTGITRDQVRCARAATPAGLIWLKMQPL